MAFTNPGHFFLANGASMWITTRFGPPGHGQNQGVLWMLADPRPFDTSPPLSGTTQLETSRIQKRADETSAENDFTYNCLVENNGGLPTFFQLAGGGVT